MSESRLVVSDSLRPHGLYSPWNSLGQKTGVGSLSLLQGIFPTQGSNPGLPHYRRILYQLSYQGNSPRKAMPKMLHLGQPGWRGPTPLPVLSCPSRAGEMLQLGPRWLSGRVGDRLGDSPGPGPCAVLPKVGKTANQRVQVGEPR